MDVGVGYDGPREGEAGGFLDASLIPEAGTDATQQPDVGIGTSFCSKLSPQPTFCSDFDEGSSSLAVWTVIAGNGYCCGFPDGGAVGLDTSTSTSAPASLHEMTDLAPADAGFFRALVLKQFGTASAVTMASDVLVATANTVAIADLSFQHPNGTEDDLDLDLINGYVFQGIPAGDSGAQGENYVASFTIDGGVPHGAWHRIALNVVVGPPATLSVMIDSTTVINAAALDPRFTNGITEVLFGVTGRPVSPMEDMHIDNVVVDTTP